MVKLYFHPASRFTYLRIQEDKKCKKKGENESEIWFHRLYIHKFPSLLYQIYPECTFQYIHVEIKLFLATNGACFSVWAQVIMFIFIIWIAFHGRNESNRYLCNHRPTWSNLLSSRLLCQLLECNMKMIEFEWRRLQNNLLFIAVIL